MNKTSTAQIELLYKLHIFKIPVPSTKHEITEFFTKFGRVLSISMKKSRNKKKFGQAKITMETKHAFDQILNADSEDLNFKGSYLRVEKFLSKKELDEKERETSQRKVIIFNLHSSIKEKPLKQYISENYGHISNFYIVERNKKVGKEMKLKRYAMITFERKEDADRLKALEMIKVFGKTLFPSNFIPRRKTIEQKKQEKWVKQILDDNNSGGEEKLHKDSNSSSSSSIEEPIELKLSEKLVISGLKKNSHLEENLRFNRPSFNLFKRTSKRFQKNQVSSSLKMRHPSALSGYGRVSMVSPRFHRYNNQACSF